LVVAVELDDVNEGHKSLTFRFWNWLEFHN
jgi:hypothetical protein